MCIRDSVDTIIRPFQCAYLNHAHHSRFAHGITHMLVNCNKIGLGGNTYHLSALALFNHLISNRLAYPCLLYTSTYHIEYSLF